MPRCLFVYPTYPPPFVGGSVVYYAHVHQAFGRDDLVVMTAAAPGDDAFDSTLPYRVHRTRCMHWTRVTVPPWRKAIEMVCQFFLAWRLIRQERVQVIHVGQMYPDIVMGRLLARLTGRFCVVTVHAEELTVMPTVPRLRRHLVLRALRRADRVVTVSAFTREVLIDHKVLPDRIVLIPPCADPRKCDPADVREPACAARLGTSRVLLTVGRLIRRKGQDKVLAALAKLVANHPDLHYVMVGRGPDEERLRQMVADLALKERVTFVDDAREAEIAWLYQRCEAFVMPNRTLPNGDTEGYGIVFDEAGAWGKPVIGGDAGGVRDAVVHAETGLLVDGGDAVAIERAIDSLLTDPERARRMGEAGRRRSASRTWADRSATLKNLLEGLR